jgi:TrmH family RNA methyltransferase
VFLCDGQKLLKEAAAAHMEIMTVLWKENGSPEKETTAANHFLAPEDLFDYASPMINSPGPLFTVTFPVKPEKFSPHCALVLENVQDPGNVGTVIRTANAFGIDAVVLVGACADPYHPKTVRATMGAVFRQQILCLEHPEELKTAVKAWNLPLYGAVLSERAQSVLNCELAESAVAVGSEGRGLSAGLRDLCDGEIIIPMQPESESLNAAVAASVLMWEMKGRRQ